MARIIAGRFETQAQADAVLAALSRAGFQKQDYTCFYLTPPGQHGAYPIGGDAHHDEGTKESGKKAITGAAIGSVTGLALGTATGAALGEPGFTAAGALAGAGIGGYVGSLAGGLTGARSGHPAEATKDEPVERPSGIMVAVRVDEGRQRETIRVLRAEGALEIERAEGEWRDGAWADFDPRRIPRTIDPLEGS
jgi:outer membrane lipoprotein SlyB